VEEQPICTLMPLLTLLLLLLLLLITPRLHIIHQ